MVAQSADRAAAMQAATRRTKNSHKRRACALAGTALVMRDAQFQSKAYGTHAYKDIAIEGRVQFDMLTAVQREHKLSSYSLNAVSAHFLGARKRWVARRDAGRRGGAGGGRAMAAAAALSVSSDDRDNRDNRDSRDNRDNRDNRHSVSGQAAGTASMDGSAARPWQGRFLEEGEAR